MTLMAQNQDRQKRVKIASLIKADVFRKRLRGLIGSKELKKEEGLWIPSCPSVHTFFMSFPIDILFTDKNMVVVSLFENIKPWRIIFGGWKSHHTFEIQAGRICSLQLKKGDLVYVES